MGKRSDFKRNPKDLYCTTDPRAIPAQLVKEIRGKTYAEPCYGVGDLEDLLMDVATCKWRSDIESRVGCCVQMDALDLTEEHITGIDLIVTNLPWTRNLLHPMIEHFSNLRPTWLLFDAGWLFTKQASPYLPRLRKVIALPRLKWVKDSPYSAKDDCCWYLFDKPSGGHTIEFYGVKDEQFQKVLL